MGHLKVLMVGNAPVVKGGITSVITQLLSYDWDKDGIEMSFIPTYEEGSMIHKAVYFTRAYFEIRKQIRIEKPDTIHIHMSYKGSFVRKYKIHKLCMKEGIADVVHLHGSEFKKWYDASSHRTQKKIRKMLRECSSFIVLGFNWERIVKQIEPMTRTVVVGNTVIIPDKVCVWNKNPFQVLFLGVLIKRKGVSDLLNAIKLIKSSRGTSNINFIIAGSGEEENSLINEMHELDLENSVSFTGWISGEQKQDLLKESQMLVLPSYNEGLPVSILEAISYGLPVVSTNVGDISSAVRDGENGYLVKPGDIKQLAESILKIYDNEEMYMKMSKESRRIAETCFSDSDYFKKIESCYRTCV